MNSSRFDKDLLQDSRAAMLGKDLGSTVGVMDANSSRRHGVGGGKTKRHHHQKAKSVITKKSSLDKLLDL